MQTTYIANLTWNEFLQVRLFALTANDCHHTVAASDHVEYENAAPQLGVHRFVMRLNENRGVALVDPATGLLDAKMRNPH